METYHWIVLSNDTETCAIWEETFPVAVAVTVNLGFDIFPFKSHIMYPYCSFCRGKTNYINLGSFLIKPVQRVMRYPLLLMELLGATPDSHHDRTQLTQALQAVKDINVNINEYKRRKDLGITPPQSTVPTV